MGTFDNSMRQTKYLGQLQPTSTAFQTLLTRFPKSEQHPSLADYARQALNEALEAGLQLEDIQNVLGEASLTEIIPPKGNEDINEYKNRATSELLLRYLVSGTMESRSEFSKQRRRRTTASNHIRP